MRHLLPLCPPPYYLFSHSMGGAVSALLLERYDHPFSRAVLCAPMIRLHTKRGLSPFWNTLISNSFCAVGLSHKRVPFMRVPDGNRPLQKSSSLSPARYAHFNALCRKDPTLLGGAPTLGWVKEACAVTGKILQRGAPERIDIPLRLYSAQHDHLVEERAQRRFIARTKNGVFLPVFGSKHEIYNANDKIAHAFFQSVLDFFKEQ